MKREQRHDFAGCGAAYALATLPLSLALALPAAVEQAAVRDLLPAAAERARCRRSRSNPQRQLMDPFLLVLTNKIYVYKQLSYPLVTGLRPLHGARPRCVSSPVAILFRAGSGRIYTHIHQTPSVFPGNFRKRKVLGTL